VGPIPADWWRSLFTGVALDAWRGFTTDDLTRAEADFIETTLALPPAARVLDAYGSLDREPFRFGSPRLLLVAKKREEETS